jgi:hypothetical protein
MCSQSDNVVLMCSRAGLCYYTDPNNLGVQKTLNFDGGSLHVVKGQECNELIVKCHERTLYLRASSQWEAAQVKTVGFVSWFKCTSPILPVGGGGKCIYMYTYVYVETHTVGVGAGKLPLPLPLPLSAPLPPLLLASLFSPPSLPPSTRPQQRKNVKNQGTL